MTFLAGVLLLLLGPLEPNRSVLDANANAADESGPEANKEAESMVTNQVPMSDAQFQVLKQLEQRKEDLDHRERELNRTEERLRIAERELDKRLTQLKDIRTEITTLFEQEKEARDARLKSMTATLGRNMKPKQSAEILSRLDTDLALTVMAEIPSQQLSKIFEKMDKDRAAELTAAFLKRKNELPKLPN